MIQLLEGDTISPLTEHVYGKAIDIIAEGTRLVSVSSSTILFRQTLSNAVQQDKQEVPKRVPLPVWAVKQDHRLRLEQSRDRHQKQVDRRSEEEESGHWT